MTTIIHPKDLERLQLAANLTFNRYRVVLAKLAKESGLTAPKLSNYRNGKADLSTNSLWQLGLALPPAARFYLLSHLLLRGEKEPEGKSFYEVFSHVVARYRLNAKKIAEATNISYSELSEMLRGDREITVTKACELLKTLPAETRLYCLVEIGVLLLDAGD
jgi:transcriptional regulator with XRE-family HTH domain